MKPYNNVLLQQKLAAGQAIKLAWLNQSLVQPFLQQNCGVCVCVCRKGGQGGQPMVGKIHPTDLPERNEAVGCKVRVTILGVDKKYSHGRLKEERNK